jgi:hypothetical protein
MPKVAPLEVTDGNLSSLRPAAITHQVGQRAQPLDEAQGHSHHTLGHGRRAAAGSDDDGDAPPGGGGDIDQVHAYAGSGQHAKVGHTVEQGLVHHHIGSHYGAGGQEEVLRLGLGHEER